MSFFSEKKLLLIGFVLVLLTVIPITVYFLQRQQEVRIRAEKATNLSFSPTSSQTSPIQKNVGQTFDLDVMMNPGNNQVIATKLVITYDDTKLATVSGTCGTSLCHNQNAFPSVLEGPIYTARSGSNPASVIITMTVGIDITKAIQTTTKIATITFRALSQTPTTEVAFDTTRTNVTSTSDPEANVLSTTTPAVLAIAAGPTPTPGPTSPPSKPPVCDSFNTDRTPTGVAPFAIAIAVNGSDPDSTISKVTIDFGDGPAQEITQGSGIGTKSVQVQVAHTYNNPGTYIAKATLTDDTGVTSSGTTCTKTITVTQATPTTPQPTGGKGAPVATGSATPTLAPTATPKPSPTPIVSAPTIAPPGPGDTLIGIGVAGIILSVIGGLLLFAF